MRILDLIEWVSPTGDEIVARVPQEGSGDIRLGSQLVVRENQVAVFFRDGKVADMFTAGRYTIETANIPILINLLGLAFDGKSPFRAEVYFVNMRTFTDMKFGTKEPIVYRDKEFGMVRLRAFGTYTMRVQDPRLFVNQIVATKGLFHSDEIKDFLRDVIIARLADLLGERMKSILDLPAVYDEIGLELKERVMKDFEAIGLYMVNMYINAITPPEEVQKAIDERTSMAAIGDLDSYTKFKAARALEEAAKGGEGGEGGSAGAGLGMGAGIGMGMGMAGVIAETMRGGGKGGPAPTQPSAPSPVKCPTCGADVPPGAKFCPSCGTKMPEPSKCPACGADVPPGAKFCPSCGAKLGEPSKCPKCGADVPPGSKFCPSCGEKLE
jgi:membrane protease subunit (stomatin/prohibitin family)